MHFFKHKFLNENILSPAAKLNKSVLGTDIAERN